MSEHDLPKHTYCVTSPFTFDAFAYMTKVPRRGSANMLINAHEAEELRRLGWKVKRLFTSAEKEIVDEIGAQPQPQPQPIPVPVDDEGGGGANEVITVPQYRFTQSLARATWEVAHNLGFMPNIRCYTPGNLEIYGDVVHLSVNVAQIRFATPQTGWGRCI